MSRVDKEMERYLVDSQYIDTTTFYRAKVADTNDPLGLGRVRIRIPALHGIVMKGEQYIPDNQLPWATPGVLNGAGNDCGQFIVPPKGSTVFVFFEFHDVSMPIYFGGIPSLIGDPKYYNDNPNIMQGRLYTVTDDDRIKDIKNGSETVVYKSLKGATIIIDDKDNAEYISIIDAAGQRFTLSCEDTAIDRRGDSLESFRQYGEDEPRKFNVKAEINNGQGDSIVMTSGKVKIKTKTFEVEADDIIGI